MKVVSFFEGEKSDIVLLLGNFDGLHIGHNALIDYSRNFNHKIGILTFENLPKGNVIKTIQERFLQYERFEMDFVIVLDYNEIKSYTAKEFLTILLNNFPNIKGLICGEDFNFGVGAKYNIEDIRKFLTAHQDISFLPIKCVTINDKKISTSQIKNFLFNGKIEIANKYLLEDYSIFSTVVSGKKLGRIIGFPTMNFNIDKLKIKLKSGVYAVYCYVDNIKYYGVANLGIKPTVEDFNANLEVHLINFSKDMYGKDVEIFFFKYIREIKKFDSVETLKIQISKDINEVKKYAKEIY